MQPSPLIHSGGWDLQQLFVQMEWSKTSKWKEYALLPAGISAETAAAATLVNTPKLHPSASVSVTNGGDDAIVDGDWTLRVHVIRAADLHSEDANGSVDPYVEAAALGLTPRHTATVAKDTSPVFDEWLVLDIPAVTRETLRSGSLSIRVLDSDFFGLRAEAIGSFKISLADVYSSPGHEFYRRWVALADYEEPGDAGCQGYLQVTVALLGPDDVPVVHDRDVELAAADEAAAATATSGSGDGSGGGVDGPRSAANLLLPPQLQFEPWFVVATIAEGDGLPCLDSVAFSARRALDAFVRLEVGGHPPVDTPVSSAQDSAAAPGTVHVVWGPAEAWVPLHLPSLAPRVRLSVWDADATSGADLLAAAPPFAIADLQRALALAAAAEVANVAAAAAASAALSFGGGPGSEGAAEAQQQQQARKRKESEAAAAKVAAIAARADAARAASSHTDVWVNLYRSRPGALAGAVRAPAGEAGGGASRGAVVCRAPPPPSEFAGRVRLSLRLVRPPAALKQQVYTRVGEGAQNGGGECRTLVLRAAIFVAADLPASLRHGGGAAAPAALSAESASQSLESFGQFLMGGKKKGKKHKHKHKQHRRGMEKKKKKNKEKEGVGGAEEEEEEVVAITKEELITNRHFAIEVSCGAPPPAAGAGGAVVTAPARLRKGGSISWVAAHGAGAAAGAGASGGWAVLEAEVEGMPMEDGQVRLQ